MKPEAVYICVGRAIPDPNIYCQGNPVYVCNRDAGDKTAKIYGHITAGGEVWPDGLFLMIPANSTIENGRAPRVGYDQKVLGIGDCRPVTYSVGENSVYP